MGAEQQSQPAEQPDQSDDQEAPSTFIKADLVVRNIGQLITLAQTPILGAQGRLGIIEHGALAARLGRIVWIGVESALDQAVDYRQADVLDAEGRPATPGFVDSHTHLLFAGNRAEEFHLRHQGVSYAELAAQGRGILSTVRATRAASDEELVALAEQRLERFRAYGTTTIEAKTGYGLDLETERRCLHILNAFNASPLGQPIIPTFLGAHTLPPEYRGQRGAYVDLVVEEMLPAFAGFARFCDVFCEHTAFTLEESERILTRAKELGYLLKMHADQLSASGGARLAAALGATSADHLDFADDADLEALREAGVVATLLPGCSFTLSTPYPSARRLLERGLTVALATDFNPGTSYSENMQMMLALGISAMGMTLEEALEATTINGARALAFQDEAGSLEVGKRCDVVLWRTYDYHELGYHFGVNLVDQVLIAGIRSELRPGAR
ncbi:MAG TPA: imidazolonepropionase [Ktedonobacterales bacterium]|nr:imidazolonepropionase [Ktedonobacterales bacterium]